MKGCFSGLPNKRDSWKQICLELGGRLQKHRDSPPRQGHKQCGWAFDSSTQDHANNNRMRRACRGSCNSNRELTPQDRSHKLAEMSWCSSWKHGARKQFISSSYKAASVQMLQLLTRLHSASRKHCHQVENRTAGTENASVTYSTKFNYLWICLCTEIVIRAVRTQANKTENNKPDIKV